MNFGLIKCIVACSSKWHGSKLIVSIHILFATCTGSQAPSSVPMFMLRSWSASQVCVWFKTNKIKAVMKPTNSGHISIK